MDTNPIGAVLYGSSLITFLIAIIFPTSARLHASGFLGLNLLALLALSAVVFLLVFGAMGGIDASAIVAVLIGSGAIYGVLTGRLGAIPIVNLVYFLYLIFARTKEEPGPDVAEASRP